LVINLGSAAQNRLSPGSDLLPTAPRFFLREWEQSELAAWDGSVVCLQAAARREGLRSPDARAAARYLAAYARDPSFASRCRFADPRS
jgi:hypothetical protein